MLIVVAVERQSDLFEIVATAGAARGLTGLLDGRQKQGYEHSDHGDGDQEFNQSETATARHDDRNHG